MKKIYPYIFLILINTTSYVYSMDPQIELYRFVTQGKTSHEELNKLLKAGADINHVYDIAAKIFPALLAVEYGYDETFKLLVSNGANVNQVCQKDGFTCLMEAVYSGNAQIVQQLCTCGARKDLENNEEETALDIAKKCNYGEIIQLLKD